MRAMRCGALGALAALLLVLAPAPGVHAAEQAASPDSAREGAPRDTALIQYLGGLADSTDQYFGQSAAEVDTAGLDSLLSWRLAEPYRGGGRRQFTWTIVPMLRFNRVDGPVYGAGVGWGRIAGPGRTTLLGAWSAGQDEWLGGVDYEASRVLGGARWNADGFVGRRTSVVDRERPGQAFAALRAFIIGSDSRHYLRQDGLDVVLERATPLWRARAGYRDMQESPLATTTTWNLASKTPDPLDNVAAREGRMRELRYQLAGRIPPIPFSVQVDHHTSANAIGSDFEYRRTRAAIAGDLALGGIATMVPQFLYGRLSGEPSPQASFYMGGESTLRSVDGSSLGGTGIALARLDLIGQQDVLALLRVPHPDALPIQIGAFLATGAVWGVDPYGGPPLPGVDWPNREDWLHEAGVQLLYRPGLPDPDGLLRFSFAWPLGPTDRGTRFTVAYSRALDLLNPLGR